MHGVIVCSVCFGNTLQNGNVKNHDDSHDVCSTFDTESQTPMIILTLTVWMATINAVTTSRTFWRFCFCRSVSLQSNFFLLRVSFQSFHVSGLQYAYVDIARERVGRKRKRRQWKKDTQNNFKFLFLVIFSGNFFCFLLVVWFVCLNGTSTRYLCSKYSRQYISV